MKMKRRVAIILTLTIGVLALSTGCGDKDSKAEEATEATEEASVVEITTDEVAAEATEAATEEYDFSIEEEQPSEVPTEAAAPEPEPEPETDEFGVAAIDEIKLYATEAVRIRKEPNTDSDVAGNLKAGEEVTANGKSEEWHRIVRNGDTLYVKSEYLTETKPEKKEENKDSAAADNQAAATDNNPAAAASAAAAANSAAADNSAAQQAAAAEAASQAAAQQAAAQAAAAQAAAAAASVTAGTTINCTDGALVVNSKQMDVINKYWSYTGDAVEFAGHHSKGQLQELFAAEGVN